MFVAIEGVAAVGRKVVASPSRAPSVWPKGIGRYTINGTVRSELVFFAPLVTAGTRDQDEQIPSGVDRGCRGEHHHLFSSDVGPFPGNLQARDSEDDADL